MKNSIQFYMNVLQGLARLQIKENYNFPLIYVFLCYALLRLRRLLDIKLDWRPLPDSVLEERIEKVLRQQTDYVDSDSCLLGNIKHFPLSVPSWSLVCSTLSLKKYKILIVPDDSIDENTIFLPETALHNLKNALHSTLDASFLLPIREDSTQTNFAATAKISMVSNPYESANNLTDALLKNYFSKPRFLRINDLFRVDLRKEVPEQLYVSGNSVITVYFKVNSIKINDDVYDDGAYILRGETTLIQEPNIHCYLPQTYFYNEPTNRQLINEYPSCFVEPLKSLERCILPFIESDIQLRIKPIFLVKGSQGSGKRNMIKTASKRMGLNLLNVDFAEMQALTSAQTEAKLRIVLRNAEQSAPCLLCLNNIEVFGKNFEGQKDERIISAFSSEISALYQKNLEYPVIIVATTSESKISAELHRMFIETICLDHLDQSKRADLILCLLKERRLNYEADLSKIAATCSDFNYTDLTALISHAVKCRCKSPTESLARRSLTLMQEDFDKAYEYMQSIYTDCKGVPRVPKVYWEDIGGLADLKHEIIRRIQLPLLNNPCGFGQSGLLLYGPPGTGKTLLAKAVATEFQLHFLSIKGPEVLNMYIGQSEKNVRQVFERARAAAPCIIFFDELDSLAPNRGRSGDSGGVMDRVVSQLLAEMDGLESSSSITILGATNRPDLIDPALLRPGRFDKILYVGIHTDRSSQLSVLRALTRKFKFRQNGEELENLANLLPEETTGADLYAVCSDAWLNAARKLLNLEHEDKKSNQDRSTFENEKLNDPVVTVELEDFLRAARELVPSVSKEDARKYQRMKMELSSTSQ